MPSSAAERSGRRPDRAALAAWLTSPDVVSADGSVLSWANPRHPGFPYPEAAAWWLAWAAWRRRRGEASPGAPQVRAVAERLAAEVEGGCGVGKQALIYLFDTCVAARGLAAAEADEALDGRRSRWADAVTRALDLFLDQGRCVAPEPGEASRWSQRWGAHLARAAALLVEADGLIGRPEWSERAARILARVGAEGEAALSDYVHARLYATEALWTTGGPLQAGARAEVGARLAQLRRVQRADGAVPAWLGGDGPARADASAQAARLWLALGGADDLDSARRSLAWLATQQAADGAIPYEAGSRDGNTWATLFTDQAAAWMESGEPTEGWI
jgi:hypothetical protein